MYCRIAILLALANSFPVSGETHWSLEPLPSLQSLAGISIDSEIQRTLTNQHLSVPSPAPAFRQIRRLSLMITGLPPEPETVAAYVRDPSETHYNLIVDRYLQSPHFGERWARHWMDVVRYAETYGYEWNHLIREAWRYRDYLIRAFNQDLPFDRFIREHIAGDLLESPRTNELLGINESLIGTAFYRFGETGHDDCVLYPEISLDVMDNQIDTLSKSFQALTVSCSRCHDHKLDNIPQRDYYALLGVMTSSRQVIRTLDLPGQQADLKETLRKLKREMRTELASLWRQRLTSLTVDRLIVLGTESGAESMDHPFHPWHNDDWKATGEAMRQEEDRRCAFNRQHFELFGDFTKRNAHTLAKWGMEGLAIDDAFVADGDFAILPTGPNILHSLLPAGFYSHTLSQKLNAAVRSPLLPENKRSLSYQTIGEHGSVCRTVLANCTLPYFHTNRLKSPVLGWHKLGLEHLRTSPLVRLRSYLEWATVLDDQGFPVLNMPQAQYHKTLADPRSYFGITKVFVHDIDRLPYESLNAQLLVYSHPVTTKLDLANRYQQILRDAIARWERGRSTAVDVFWLNAFLMRDLLPRTADATPSLASLVRDYRAHEARIQPPKRLVGMTDPAEPIDVAVFANGEVTAPKEKVPRGYVTMLEHLLPPEFTNSVSGRRRIAELIAHPDNPLTARVMANRIWHYLFGYGLVRSVDDFGKLGESPSHPKLLDYLARRFIDSGWSVKAIVREIVLSHTFRQSSTASETGDQLDPENRLLHRYPARRLEAEVIRDAMLWASGRLDRSMFGPSIHPYRDHDVDRRKLYAGPLDGDGRRSLYLKVTRMGPSKMLELFNFPDPSMTRGRRDRTNVPSQSLGLRNHPFVHQQARHHAHQLVSGADLQSQPLEETLARLAMRNLSRQPDESELADYVSFFTEVAAIHELSLEQAKRSPMVWSDVIHMFYNLKEFLYAL